MSKKKIVIEIDYEERRIDGLDKTGREKLIQKNKRAVAKLINNFFNEFEVYEPGEIDPESLFPKDFISICDLFFGHPKLKRFIIQPKDLSFQASFISSFKTNESGDSEIDEYCDYFETIFSCLSNLKSLFLSYDEEFIDKFIGAMKLKKWNTYQFKFVEDDLKKFSDFFYSYLTESQPKKKEVTRKNLNKKKEYGGH